MAKRLVEFMNQVTRFRRANCKPANLLLLLPACLQWSECPWRVTAKLSYCRRCGKCQVKDMIELSEEYGIQCAILTGGRLAVLRARDASVKGIVAVACEKELQEGVRYVFPKPVLGVINLRPHGPCLDTKVDVKEVRKAIEWFLTEDAGKDSVDGTDESEKPGGV